MNEEIDMAMSDCLLILKTISDAAKAKKPTAKHNVMLSFFIDRS